MAETFEPLRTVVINGVQALIALHLDGAPGFETATLTTEVWIEIVGGWNLKNTPRDSQRLAVAFKQLAGNVTRWPAPSQLKVHLPAAVQPPSGYLLPYPPEKLKRNRAMMKALLITLGQALDSRASPEAVARARRKLKKQEAAIEKIINRNKGGR